MLLWSLLAAGLSFGGLRAEPLDGAGRVVRGGKPFFVLGWYSDGEPERLERVARSPFNTVLDYGLTARPIEGTRRYLDQAARLGVAVILCVNDIYPSAKHRNVLGEWQGNEAILEGLVRAFRDHPAVLAWYTNDELPFELSAELKGYSERLRALDPQHPQLLAHFKVGGLEAFREAADIFAIDRYPVPRGKVEEVAQAVDQARSEVPLPRPVWAILQNFAWYQHKDPRTPLVPGDIDTPRARIPTPEEWDLGRPPTAEEVRAMTYLALTHGANGLLYWCLYNLEYLPDRQERWTSACMLGEEIRALEGALLATERAQVTTSAPGIHLLGKVADGHLVVLAVNASAEPVRATISLPAANARDAEVLFERRRASLSERSLTDFFPPLGRHVYRVPARD